MPKNTSRVMLLKHEFLTVMYPTTMLIIPSEQDREEKIY